MLPFGRDEIQKARMSLRLSTQTLVASALLFLAAGCKDRDVVVYRTAKEGPAPSATATAQKMPPPSTDKLPDGHPPIDGSAAPVATAPNGSAMGALPGSAVAQGNALKWTAPAHWQAKAAGSVRKGSYAIPGENGAAGDLSITAFPGDTGGLHANINRWRGQVGLAPASNAEIDQSVEHLDVNGLHVELVEMVGPSGIRLLGAIVPHQQETWFFKLTGPDALIAGEKAAFRAFVQTVQVR